MNPDQTAPWEQSDLDPYCLQQSDLGPYGLQQSDLGPYCLQYRLPNLFALLLYVQSQQLWSWQDGQFS